MSNKNQHSDSSGSSEGAKVLFVGIVCIDLVNICPKYPDEDTDSVILHQEWRRGGNASNNATVLSLLGQRSAFCGSLANSYEKTFLLSDFSRHNIDVSHCVFHDNHINIHTVVLINSTNASRTILAPPLNLPSVTLEEFRTIDLEQKGFRWIHFEALPGTENIRQLKKILQYLSEYNQLKSKTERIVTSLEVEKPEKQFEILLCEADYVFAGKDYAKFRGFSSMKQAVTGIALSCPQSEAVICTWGEHGASCRLSDGTFHHCSAAQLTNPVDSLGAGDTFTAGTIYSLLNGHSVKEAITFGCRLATTKCAMKGFDGLKGFS